MAKIKWEVQPAPTGPYKSFHYRGWPMGIIGPRSQRVLLHCKDGYVPARARTGEHGELTVKVDVWDAEKGKTQLRVLKTRAATLAEAKALAQSFFDRNPHVLRPED